jgi:hypothetical protein
MRRGRKRHQECMYTEERPMRTQLALHTSQGEKASREMKPADTLISDIQPPELVEN